MEGNPNIQTPRRFAIFIPRDYAFALMHRIFPFVEAFRVLQDTQGLIRTHSATAFLTGVVCFVLRCSPIEIAAWTIGIPLAFLALRYYGILCRPLSLWALVLFSQLTGYGLFFLLIIIFGLIFVGIWEVVAFFVARLVLEVITIILDQVRGRIFVRRFRFDFGESEAYDKIEHLLPVKDKFFMPRRPYHFYALGFDFFHVFQYHASRIGVSQSLEVSANELDESNWEPTWSEFALKWPELAARY